VIADLSLLDVPILLLFTVVALPHMHKSGNQLPRRFCYNRNHAKLLRRKIQAGMFCCMHVLRWQTARQAYDAHQQGMQSCTLEQQSTMLLGYMIAKISSCHDMLCHAVSNLPHCCLVTQLPTFLLCVGDWQHKTALLLPTLKMMSRSAADSGARRGRCACCITSMHTLQALQQGVSLCGQLACKSRKTSI